MPSLPWLLQLSFFGWFALEVVLLARRTNRQGYDRRTRTLVALTFFFSVLAGFMLRDRFPALGMPAADALVLAGVIVFWVGAALRVWAVLTFTGSFSTAGWSPYRWVRHPSYTGLLLLALGAGLCAGNWLSLAVCVVGPTLVLVSRIPAEESVLVRVLGARYRASQRATRRLVPGVW
jgi:protein-S-isoprenylcysteine O-methyltransferase Ste14